MIRITCETAQTLLLADMEEFQGGLKTRTEGDYSDIAKSIRKYGVAFPFFVWKDGERNNVLDGHGRLGALTRMEESGETIPPLPVVYVEAEDEKRAKSLLLRLNSRYGEITPDGMRQFLSGVDADLDGVSIPEIPDIAALLDEKLAAAGGAHADYAPNPPKFQLFCPECGEECPVTDEELMEAAGYENY